MKAELNRHTGAFTIHVDAQAEILRAPDADDGTPRKYVPCDHCGELQMVPLNVVSLFCDDRCASDYEFGWEGRAAHPSQRGEMSGYSHACGYHD